MKMTTAAEIRAILNSDASVQVKRLAGDLSLALEVLHAVIRTNPVEATELFKIRQMAVAAMELEI